MVYFILRFLVTQSIMADQACATVSIQLPRHHTYTIHRVILHTIQEPSTQNVSLWGTFQNQTIADEVDQKMF